MGLNLGIAIKCVAILLLGSALAACAGGEDRDAAFSLDTGGNANQPFPDNYRTELLAFMRTYLNNPVGVHDAMMAEPVQRTVGGRTRYVSCLRFSERQPDGTYREPRQHAVLFINGRLDRIVQNAGDVCVGATYAPFPELEKMTR